MRKRHSNPDMARLLSLREAAVYVGIGLDSCRAWCKQIGAEKRIAPRVVRYDRVVIDRAIDEAGENDGKQAAC